MASVLIWCLFKPTQKGNSPQKKEDICKCISLYIYIYIHIIDVSARKLEGVSPSANARGPHEVVHFVGEHISAEAGRSANQLEALL